MLETSWMAKRRRGGRAGRRRRRDGHHRPNRGAAVRVANMAAARASDESSPGSATRRVPSRGRGDAAAWRGKATTCRCRSRGGHTAATRNRRDEGNRRAAAPRSRIILAAGAGDERRLRSPTRRDDQGGWTTAIAFVFLFSFGDAPTPRTAISRRLLAGLPGVHAAASVCASRRPRDCLVRRPGCARACGEREDAGRGRRRRTRRARRAASRRRRTARPSGDGAAREAGRSTPTQQHEARRARCRRRAARRVHP